MKNMKLKKRTSRKKSKSKILYLALILLVMGIGFSYIQSTLSISGNSTITGGLWDIHFDNLIVAKTGMEATSAATINEAGDAILLALEFKEIFDYYEFEVDIVNDGTLDAMLSNIELEGLTEEYEPYLNTLVTYIDTDDELDIKDKLDGQDRTRIKVVISFNSEANIENLPLDEEGIELKLSLSYVQFDE